jgi:NAD(P)-dependent dehydrogenase (short-subunit alcohol dehydrogenase family)
MDLTKVPRLTASCERIILCSSGIGLETSLLFATEGSSLILADINLEAAERTATLIQNKFEGKIKAIAVRCDVSKEDQIEAIVKRAVDEFGRLDVMVSAARFRSLDFS